MIVPMLQSLYWLLFFKIPILISVGSTSLYFIKNKEKFYLLFTIFVNLQFFSSIALLFVMAKHDGDDRFGYVFEFLFVSGSFFSLIGTLILKLWLNSLRLKHHDTLFQYLLYVKSKIVFSLFKTLLLFVMLLQIFLLMSAFQAYTQAKNMHMSEDRNIFSFYKPFLTEIHLKNNLRWSYSRNKYVKLGE